MEVEEEYDEFFKNLKEAKKKLLLDKQKRTEQNRTEQNRTKQNKTEQNRTEFL
jgi:hypothetical protein